MPPEVIIGVIVQISLVAVVTWAFVSGKVHSDSELKRRETEHDAELRRRNDTLVAQIHDWRGLYAQERTDRIEADKRLTIATGELKEVTACVEDLTKEGIRRARQQRADRPTAEGSRRDGTPTQGVR